MANSMYANYKGLTVSDMLKIKQIQAVENNRRREFPPPYVSGVSSENASEGYETNSPNFASYVQGDESVALDTAVPIPVKRRDKIPITILTIENDGNIIREFKTVLYLWNIIMESSVFTSDSTRYISLCASIMEIMFYSSGQQTIRDILETHHDYAVTIVEFTEAQIDGLIAAEVPTQSIIREILKETADKSNQVHLGISYTLAGVIMIMLGKSINVNVSAPWFMSRYRALASKGGFLDAHKVLTKLNVVPNKELCGDFYSTLNGHFEFRREMFLRLRMIKSAKVKASYICGVIVDYLAWTEMSHIDIIMRYIIEKFPEVMSMRTLSVFQGPLNRALTYMRSKPTADQRWIKLLYPTSESYPLESQKFTTLTAVARHIATKFQSSFTNYTVNYDSMSSKLFPIIDTYIDSRLAIGGMEIVRSAHVASYAQLDHLDMDKDLTIESGGIRE